MGWVTIGGFKQYLRYYTSLYLRNGAYKDIVTMEG